MPEIDGIDGIDEDEIRRLVEGPAGRRLLREYAVEVRERARAKAGDISPTLPFAIVEAAPAIDPEEGIHVDIGYDKRKPGFVLWWHEVGTQDYPASPHLRPALESE